MKREFTPNELRHLDDVQKNYLIRNPGIFSLQPYELSSEALYQTPHGAVTIDRAIELDALRETHNRQQAAKGQPFFDSYSNAEDTFIDRNGMSSGLF